MKRSLNLSGWFLISLTMNLSSYSRYPCSFRHLLLLLKITGARTLSSLSRMTPLHFMSLLPYWRVNACLSNLIAGHLRGLCKINRKGISLPTSLATPYQAIRLHNIATQKCLHRLNRVQTILV